MKTLYFVIIVCLLITGCASMSDVLRSKDEGTVQVYSVDQG
jgi:uncharacterized protein YceK